MAIDPVSQELFTYAAEPDDEPAGFWLYAPWMEEGADMLPPREAATDGAPAPDTGASDEAQLE